MAYADFITAMMALFLVLWLVSQADIEVKQAIASYFRSPGVFDTQAGGVLDGPKKVSKEPTDMTSKEEDQALTSIAAMLKKKFQTRPEFSAIRDQVKIDVTEQGLRIQIVDKADRVSFASGSAAVAAEASAVLAEIARGICNLPNPIQVGGHTDRHLFAPGSTYTNWELSTDRANAARRTLEANCVKPENVKRVVGHADTELLFPDDPFAPANRRISIIVLRQLPVPGTNEESKPAGDHTGSEPDKKTPEDDEKKASDETHASPVVSSEKTIQADEKSSHQEASSTAAQDEDLKLLKTKLTQERSVSVGVPDKMPANVVRKRESHVNPKDE